MIHKTNIFAAPIICGAALALALAAGCDKMTTIETPTGFPEDGVVRIAANAGDPLTRADGTSSREYSGTTLGLFIDYGGGIYTKSNVKWTKSESDWAPEEQMLWKNSKDAAKVYAYAPYVEGQDDPTTVEFSIPSDQSQGTLAADLVSWGNHGLIPDASRSVSFSSDGKILISFYHSLVKLTFTFEKGSQFASDVTISEAVLLGTLSKVVLNATEGSADVTSFVRGTVAAASDAAGLDIKLHKVSDLKWEGIFFPGDGQKAGARMLQVKMSDNTLLNYVVPSTGLVSGGLKSGCAYEMKMRLGKDKIEVADVVSVDDWTTDSGTTLPGGEAQLKGIVWDGTVASEFAGGTGTEDDPYLIATPAQLAYLAQQVNGGEAYEGKYFIQTEDFNLAGENWTPIGTGYVKAFKGNFDGNNHEIFGLNVDITGSYAGLFGIIKSGSVKNVKILSGSVKTNKYYVGGIVGDLDNSSTMENCTASVNVSGEANVGGLAGSITSSTVSNCHFLSGEIVGTRNVGGIVGNVQTRKSSVKYCSANASVKGSVCVGGLCGWFGNEDHEFSNCTVKGTITVTGNNCGGLVGRLYDSKGKFNECQFEGSIKKDGDNVSTNTGIAIGADYSNVTFKNCVCTIDKQTDTSLSGEKVGHIESPSSENKKVRSDNYDYSDITVTVKADDTQN